MITTILWVVLWCLIFGKIMNKAGFYEEFPKDVKGGFQYLLINLFVVYSISLI